MEHAANILVVNDGTSKQAGLAPLLSTHGYHVDRAETGRAALEIFETMAPDVMILGLQLPDMESSDICRCVRHRFSVPIIVLAARGHEAERIAALDEGADDYLMMPFSSEELLSRVRLAVRHGFDTVDEPSILRLADLTIDFGRQRVVRGGHEVHLNAYDFELLTYLARHANRVLTYHTILRANPAVMTTCHLWERIGLLRKKIETDPFRPRHLVSEPWVGYRFVAGT
jgi:two-component system KDP operon response regulator KdpE